MKRVFITICTLLFIWSMIPASVYGAYHHQYEDDSGNFLAVYPQKAHTKLDSCALCHKGGTYAGKKYGSCQYCHAVYDLTGNVHGSFQDTLNGYGIAYQGSGSSSAAVSAIAALDSDGDGYSNIVEILADRYPGDPKDDPSKTPAPSRVYTLAQLESMKQHTQFMLMNATRSDDSYVEYTGVPVKDLLDDAGIMLETATNILVYSPDGFSYFHPLYSTENMYHVYGNEIGKDYQYPSALYYYDQAANKALYPAAGWCFWDAPSCTGRQPGDSISVGDGGLKAILAIKREGQYLVPGVLNSKNKLDGEGPFRLVVPQKNPCPPDQPSTNSNGALIWPYMPDWDHNAGACSRTATIIKVEPLAENQTDIDVMEAGWTYVDQKKIVIYGAIDGSDSNGNGLLDSEEGADASADYDGDSVPDYKDVDTAKPNMGFQYLIHTSSGEFVNVRTLNGNESTLSTQGTPLVDQDNDGRLDLVAPYGVTDFTVTGLSVGGSVTITLKYPHAVPTTAQYYKISPVNGWVKIPFESNDGDSIITLSLKDGDPLTDADGVANGEIVDPSALVVTPSAAVESGITDTSIAEVKPADTTAPQESEEAAAEESGDHHDRLCFIDSVKTDTAGALGGLFILLGFFTAMAGRVLKKSIG